MNGLINIKQENIGLLIIHQPFFRYINKATTIDKNK